jgi:hypothetical protein
MSFMFRWIVWRHRNENAYNTLSRVNRACISNCNINMCFKLHVAMSSPNQLRASSLNVLNVYIYMQLISFFLLNQQTWSGCDNTNHHYENTHRYHGRQSKVDSSTVWKTGFLFFSVHSQECNQQLSQKKKKNVTNSSPPTSPDFSTAPARDLHEIPNQMEI